MTAHRTATTAGLAGVVPLLLTALAAGPAYAHGAPTDPVSRVAACAPEGEHRSAEACRAAVAANGGRPFDAWDNLRLAGVAGRDRQVVPDGKLCSAGIGAYRGLDTPRSDWPATELTAGSRFTLTYRSTIPHRGTFSLYLTEEGHDPAVPLRWADLAPEPFATVTDPELVDGAYRITGILPTGLTGRHVLYTVWRNTDTPDTYYSCSDVVFPDGDARAEASADSSADGSAEASVGPGASSGESAARGPATPPPSVPRAEPAAVGSPRALDPVLAGGAAVLAGAAVAAVLLFRRRPRRAPKY
ncbi:lytic polysaccharide monooxygenase [Streptomyces sp. NPDC051219]|uniref:lytic polysaccharide monooxygenase auxiliary activity family 9 protein n=1 Tax=Streptomyces sp. NPDC051219 TaxID=3155283 RepID=UPI0034447BC5